MRKAFFTHSRFKKQARAAALAWTVIILIACFTPGKELPKVDVPFFDKWTHLVLFGGFSFLWWCGYPGLTVRMALVLITVSSVFGGAIELFQGLLSFLGRSMEFMDWVADTVGGALGVGIYAWLAYLYRS